MKYIRKATLPNNNKQVIKSNNKYKVTSLLDESITQFKMYNQSEILINL